MIGEQISELDRWNTLEIKFLPESLHTYAEMNSPVGPFMVIESDAFFESYCHVLNGLREFNRENMPLQNYIVRWVILYRILLCNFYSPM